MKRCPQCSRVESDNTLTFCRVDGVALVTGTGSDDVGTVRFDSSSVAGETQTTVLPQHLTNPGVAAPTTVLPSRPTPTNTRALSRSKRWPLLAALGCIVAVLATAGYFYWSRTKNTTAIGSIAVMPFVNDSGSPDIDYLSDGMTETLISSLSQLPNLSVKARSSVFRYKGKETDARTIGKDLNVQAVLNGRVVQRDEQLTLTLELVDVQNENVIWSEQYKRKQADLVSLQSDIARDVSSKLKTRLSGTDEKRVTKNYTENTEAYQLYLQGRFFANKRTPQSIQKAIQYYQQAIQKDPNYALGHAGLSDGYGLLAYYANDSAPTALNNAREAAMRALSLDNNLAEGHNALGFVLVTADFDYAGGEREYRRALQLDPNYTQAHHNLGVMLSRTGRPTEGMDELRRALDLEPFSTVVNRLYGEVLIFSRRYEEGLGQLKKTVDMDPSFPTTYFALANAYRLMGKYAESVESFARFQELYDRQQTAEFARASFASGGWHGYLREMTAKRPKGLSPYLIAVYYTELGNKDEAFVELNKALANREFLIRFLKIDPSVDPLRDDPRFKDLLSQMKLAS